MGDSMYTFELRKPYTSNRNRNTDYEERYLPTLIVGIVFLGRNGHREKHPKGEERYIFDLTLLSLRDSQTSLWYLHHKQSFNSHL
jgi:hypothetical protein